MTIQGDYAILQLWFRPLRRHAMRNVTTPIKTIDFFCNFIYQVHQRKRRYSCNLQIIHGNLRSVSPDRVPHKNICGQKAGPLPQCSGFLLSWLNGCHFETPFCALIAGLRRLATMFHKRMFFTLPCATLADIRA